MVLKNIGHLLLLVVFAGACRPVNRSSNAVQTPEVGATFTQTITAKTSTQLDVIENTQTISIPPEKTATVIVSKPTITIRNTLVTKASASDIFKICSPVKRISLGELSEVISAEYDPPAPGREERHHGIDISHYRKGDSVSILGEGVCSILPGRVAAAITDKYPYGNMVIIETTYDRLSKELVDLIGINKDQSLYVLYAHMKDSPKVELGDVVQLCQLLGKVGESGNADIPHLHIETRIGPSGFAFSSMTFYNTSATEEEMDNYKLWRTSGVFSHFDPMDVLSFK